MTPARQKIGGRKPRTRRHLRYRGVRDFLGRIVGRELVNAGKDYRPRPALTMASRFSASMGTAQRDVRGHGLSTSRVKRVRRETLLGGIYRALAR